jgi:beta-mannosidase
VPRRIVDLGGGSWRLGRAAPTPSQCSGCVEELDSVRDWIPATVPGNVQADLVRAGQLPDLSVGQHARAAQWVDGHCWWLVRQFPLTLAPGERVHLVLNGVDYIHDAFLNGRHLGRHEGMFSTCRHDITALIQPINHLAVRVLGSRWLPQARSTFSEKLANHLEARLGGVGKSTPHRRDTLKAQMGFGWDFAPALRSVGIWDDVYVVVSGGAFIRGVAVRSTGAAGAGQVCVSAEIEAGDTRQVLLRASLQGLTFESSPVVAESPTQLAPGTAIYTLELQPQQPRLWWPWDHGDPELYELAVELVDQGQVVDKVTQPVGLRTVELEGGTLRINGQRVFVRGANWVPADVLPGRVSPADYAALLALARRANMNMLRVWGGGLREKRAFYDLCDRLGILVWQEFPFACAFLTRYPRSAEYLRLAQAEAGAIVRDVRNHPSVVLWCGGNEFDPERNRPLVAALREVVTAEDPSRPFLPASPADGDHHNWHVWHEFEPPSAYRRDMASFASEFGLQSPPGVQSLGRFLSPAELWPPGRAWTYHGAGLKKLWRYARPFLPSAQASRPRPAWRTVTPELFVRASQRAQAHGLQIGIEHFRRRKASGCGGLLIWQLNEPWPAISWSLVDFYRQPKPAYESVRRLFEPVLVSLDFPLREYHRGDVWHADVWVVNDGPQALSDCRVEVVLEGQGERPAGHFERELDVPADSARIVDRIAWELPPAEEWRLACTLEQAGRVLAANEYDLSVHDGIRPAMSQRLWTWLTHLVMHL